jgi:hypothetical protein
LALQSVESIRAHLAHLIFLPFSTTELIKELAIDKPQTKPKVVRKIRKIPKITKSLNKTTECGFRYTYVVISTIFLWFPSIFQGTDNILCSLSVFLSVLWLVSSFIFLTGRSEYSGEKEFLNFTPKHSEGSEAIFFLVFSLMLQI